MAIVILVVTAFVVFAMAAVTIGRETHRLDAVSPAPALELVDAVDWIAERLPESVSARITYEDVRDLVTWHLQMLDDESLDVSGYEWRMDAARALHRNLVRAPLHTVPYQTMPPWLKLHTHGHTFWAVVQDDGTLHFPDPEGPSALAYDSMLGLHTRPGQPQPRYTEDDDELDS